MTGPEVTAAMKAEGVDAGLAERVANGFLSRLDLGDASPCEVRYMQAVLATAIPAIQAQAWNAPRSSLGDDLRSIARDLGPEQAFTARLLEQAADQADFMRRALIELGDAHARLTATARETTT